MGVIQNSVDSLITTATSMSYNNAYRKSLKNMEDEQKAKDELDNAIRRAQEKRMRRVSLINSTKEKESPNTTSGSVDLNGNAIYETNLATGKISLNNPETTSPAKPLHYKKDESTSLVDTYKDLVKAEKDMSKQEKAKAEANKSLNFAGSTVLAQQATVNNMYEELKKTPNTLHTFTRTERGNSWLESAEHMEASGMDPKQVDIRRNLMAEDWNVDSKTTINKESLLGNQEALELLKRGKEHGLSSEEFADLLKYSEEGNAEIARQNQEDEEHYDEYVQAMSEEREYLTGEQLDKYKSEYDESVKTKAAEETGKDTDYSVDFEPSPDDTPEERKWKNFYKARSEEKRTGQDFIKENSDLVPLKGVKYGVKDFFTEYAYKALKNPDKYKKIEDLSYDEAKALYNNYASEQREKAIKNKVNASRKYKTLKELKDRLKTFGVDDYQSYLDAPFMKRFTEAQRLSILFSAIEHDGISQHLADRDTVGLNFDENYVYEVAKDLYPEKFKEETEYIDTYLDSIPEMTKEEFEKSVADYKKAVEFEKAIEAEDDSTEEKTKKNPFDNYNWEDFKF